MHRVALIEDEKGPVRDRADVRMLTEHGRTTREQPRRGIAQEAAVIVTSTQGLPGGHLANRRRIALAAAVCALALSMTACGSVGSSGGSQEPRAATATARTSTPAAPSPTRSTGGTYTVPLKTPKGYTAVLSGTAGVPEIGLGDPGFIVLKNPARARVSLENTTPGDREIPVTASLAYGAAGPRVTALWRVPDTWLEHSPLNRDNCRTCDLKEQFIGSTVTFELIDLRHLDDSVVAAGATEQQELISEATRPTYYSSEMSTDRRPLYPRQVVLPESMRAEVEQLLGSTPDLIVLSLNSEDLADGAAQICSVAPNGSQKGWRVLAVVDGATGEPLSRSAAFTTAGSPCTRPGAQMG